MGWDASITKNNKSLRLEDVSPTIKQAFEQASDNVWKTAGAYDAGLNYYGLCTNKSASCLSKAMDVSPYDEDGWSADKVKELYANSKWIVPESKDDWWAFYSAKAFVEVCIEHDLGIRFSF